MAQRNDKAVKAGIKEKPAGEIYRPSDVRERRDMIKNFVAKKEFVEAANDKLFKVMVSDS